MSVIFLVRHGNTRQNSAERFWGRTDVELSAEGIRAAERLRDRLASKIFDTIYASNLSRARVTAEIIAAPHSLDIVTDDDINEIDFGQIEGLTLEEIGRQHPELSRMMNLWQANPAFPGGESLEDLNRRVQRFLGRLKEHGPEETVLIVSHAGTLRLMICNLLKMGAAHWRQLRLDLASLSIMETYPEGAVLSQLNDISHLDA